MFEDKENSDCEVKKTPEEILSLSSQERREKATNGLLSKKNCSTKYCREDLNRQETVALVSVLRACHARNHLH